MRMAPRPPAPARTADLAELARSSDVIIAFLSSHRDLREMLFATGGLAQGLSPGKIVIDQSSADPEQTRKLSDELQAQGVVLIDAPMHTERLETVPEAAAIMCGGPSEAVQSLRALLECLCPKVIYCGDTGNGHAMNLVVSAVAACNRLVTYECATVGIKNGLALEHMALVLNKSSGYNSASARLLPVLSSGARVSDVPLGNTVETLKLATQLAMRHGAPMLVASLACAILEGAMTILGRGANLDETARIFEASAGINFRDAGASGSALASKTANK